MFAAKTEKGKFLELLRADATKIVRHTKIRKEANPYDPEWDLYFEEREGNRMFESMKGRKRLIEMWQKQNRRCLICGNEINKESGWKIHIGNSGKKELIHPDCHASVHSVTLNVESAEMQ